METVFFTDAQDTVFCTKGDLKVGIGPIWSEILPCIQDQPVKEERVSPRLDKRTKSNDPLGV